MLMQIQMESQQETDLEGVASGLAAGVLLQSSWFELMMRWDYSMPFLRLYRDQRTGRNIQHAMATLLRQSIYSCLAVYEDVNDAKLIS